MALVVHKRDASSPKAKDLRAEGKLVGVVYGHGVESTPVMADYQEFRKLFRTTGRALVMELDLDGKTISTLVHAVEHEPVSGNYEHVDFLVVNENEKIHSFVPLRLEGLAPAVKNLSAILATPIKQLEIACLPKDLTKEVVVDVTSLEKFHQSIHVKNLPIFNDERYSVFADPEGVVVTTVAPRGVKLDADGNVINEVVAEAPKAKKKK